MLDDPLYALVPKRFITTTKETISLATLTNMPLLVLNAATALRRMLETTLKERQLTLRRYEFARAQTLISMAGAGLGAAIFAQSGFADKDKPNDLRLAHRQSSLVRQVSVITARGQALSPASLRLVQLLRQLIADPHEKRAPKKGAARRATEWVSD